MDPTGTKEPAVWPPPSFARYGLPEVPGPASDDVRQGRGLILGNRALEVREVRPGWPGSWRGASVTHAFFEVEAMFRDRC